MVSCQYRRFLLRRGIHFAGDHNIVLMIARIDFPAMGCGVIYTLYICNCLNAMSKCDLGGVTEHHERVQVWAIIMVVKLGWRVVEYTIDFLIGYRYNCTTQYTCNCFSSIHVCEECVWRRCGSLPAEIRRCMGKTITYVYHNIPTTRADSYIADRRMYLDIRHTSVCNRRSRSDGEVISSTGKQNSNDTCRQQGRYNEKWSDLARRIYVLTVRWPYN
jgi:hypothetical protein